MSHRHSEPEDLLRLFPQAAIREATLTLTQVSQVTEEKAMYDSREKAIRDRQGELNASRRKGVAEGMAEGRAEGFAEGLRMGEIQGEQRAQLKARIEMILMLQAILDMPVAAASEFEGKSQEELEELIAKLQDQIRSRRSP